MEKNDSYVSHNGFADHVFDVCHEYFNVLHVIFVPMDKFLGILSLVRVLMIGPFFTVTAIGGVNFYNFSIWPLEINFAVQIWLLFQDKKECLNFFDAKLWNFFWILALHCDRWNFSSNLFRLGYFFANVCWWPICWKEKMDFRCFWTIYSPVSGKRCLPISGLCPLNSRVYCPSFRFDCAVIDPILFLGSFEKFLSSILSFPFQKIFCKNFDCQTFVYGCRQTSLVG